MDTSAHVGQSATVERAVLSAVTASARGADFPPAASTPFVLGLAEISCHAAVAEALAPIDITEGRGALIEHLAPSRLGAVLRTTAQVVSAQRNRLEFRLEVYDGDRLVVTVNYSRAVVASTQMVERLTMLRARSTFDMTAITARRDNGRGDPPLRRPRSHRPRRQRVLRRSPKGGHSPAWREHLGIRGRRGSRAAQGRH